MINKRKIGSDYEAEAVKYLEAQGYIILEQNFWCKMGEIDIVAKDGAEIVFVEVKYRRNLKMEDPAAAINYKKQKIIYRTARVYLKYNGLQEDIPCRFDAVIITGNELKVIRNAFGGIV